jgi:hypothetical protein
MERLQKLKVKMMERLCDGLTLGLLAVLAFRLFTVWGLYDRWDVYKPRFFGAACNLCRVFWLSMALGLALGFGVLSWFVGASVALLAVNNLR